MSENEGAWSTLATLWNARPTPVSTCLEGKEKENALRMARKAQVNLAKQDYGALLDVLDPDDGNLVHGTDLIEQSILAMLYHVKLENPLDKDFKNAIGPHKERIEKIAKAVARARSLTVLVDNTLPNTHDRLVDYVERIRLSRETMTDDPQFWRWLTAYPGIDGLLRRNEELRTNKTNSFVCMLSEKFRAKERSQEYMNHVNSICQGIMDKCESGDIEEYVSKISETYETAFTEMQLFVILEKEFGDVKVEAKIPCSCKNSDLSIEVDGDTYFVEAYTSRTITFSHVSQFRVDPRDEWTRLFRKTQVQYLALADKRTVFVLNVGSDYLSSDETCRQDFRAHVSAAMPRTSEVVIIREKGDVEVLSVRNGEVVNTTSLGKRLETVIGNAWQ